MKDIYEVIKTKLNKVAKDLVTNHSNEDWTNEIKRKLSDLGEEREFDICTSGFGNAYSGEWLFDLIWYKNTNGLLNALELAVESEWKRDEDSIKYDFEKLLVTNAKYRLFICQVKPDETELWSYFQKAINNYDYLSKGFSVLIAMLDDYDTGLFTYKKITK